MCFVIGRWFQIPPIKIEPLSTQQSLQTTNVSDQSTQITQQKPYKVESIFGNDIKISWNTKLEMLGNFSLKMLRPIIGCRGLSFSHHLSVCMLIICVKIWLNFHRILSENLWVFFVVWQIRKHMMSVTTKTPWSRLVYRVRAKVAINHTSWRTEQKIRILR